jgi:hypothetical protein
MLMQGLLAKLKLWPKNKQDFPILHDVSGVVRPGRQVSIKKFLLCILNFGSLASLLSANVVKKEMMCTGLD